MRKCVKRSKHSNTGSEIPATPLRSLATPLHSQPFIPSLRSARTHRIHRYAPVAPLSSLPIGPSRASSPRATFYYLLPPPATPICLHRLFIRAITRTISTRIRREHWKSRSSIERTNTHFVSVTDTHAQKRRTAISRYPSSFSIVTLKRRRLSSTSSSTRCIPPPPHPSYHP